MTGCSSVRAGMRRNEPAGDLKVYDRSESDSSSLEMEINVFRSAALILALVLVVAGCVAIPTKNEPAVYTQALVQDAIRLYNQEGRQAAVNYFSSPENVDGPWYVFIIGEDGYTIAHYRPESVGRDPAQRIDAAGYFYGDEILSATEAGKWVSYVHDKPDTGEVTRKHTWVVRHDGLYFGSGWYEKE